MKDSGGHSVKLEGGSEILESIERILTAGIPVMGHLGLTPQSIYKFGTYTVRAREEEEAKQLIEDVIMLGEGPNIKTKSSELASASVLGEVIEQTRGPKITIFKKKRRQNYRRKKGHRQNLTLVRIKSINLKASKTTTTKQVSKPAESKLKTTKNKVSQTAKKNNITKKTKSTSSKE